MNTGDTRQRRLRLFLLPLGALILAGMLLATWMGALAAEKPGDKTISKANNYIIADDSLISEQAGPQDAAVLAPDEAEPAQIPPLTDDLFNFSMTYGPSSGFVINQSNVNRYTFQVIPTQVITGHNFIITINDPLPPGVSWNPTSVSSSRWNCSNLTYEIDCEYSVGGAGYFQNLTVYVNVSSDAGTEVDNEATLTVQQGITVVHETQRTLTPINSIDLGLQKTATLLTAGDTQTLQYTLSITNAGPANAGVMRVIDVLDVDLPLLSQEPNDGSFNVSTGIWAVPPSELLPPDGQAIVKILQFDASGLAPGTNLTNNAQLTSSVPDYVPANNFATTSVVIGGLTINKNQLLPPGTSVVGAGQIFTYTVNVPRPAAGNYHNVMITDTLHPDLDYVRSTSGFSYNAATRTLVYNYRVDDEIYSPEDAAIPTLVIQVKPSSSITFQVPITNTATVSWIANSQRVHQESNETRIEAGPGGALQISKDDNVSNVLPGQAISYTVALTNTGNIAINDIVVDDVMNANLTQTSIQTNSLGTGSCSTSTTCRLVFSNPLAAGQKVTFRVGARVNNSASADQQTVNTISVSGIYEDESGASVTTTDTEVHRTNIDAAPDYNISGGKQVSPRQAQVNENLTFRITVNNEGSVDAPDVRVFDEFPDELDVTNVTSNRGTATLNTAARTIDVNVGVLPAGGSVRIDVVTRVNSAVTRVDTLENEAEITYGTNGELNVSTRFRVLPSGTLPTTGWPPSETASQMAGPGIAPLLSAGGLLLGLGLSAVLLGLLLLAAGLYARARKPLRAGGYARAGLLLMTLGLMAVIAGVVMLPAQLGAEGPAELGMLRGAKPPMATRLPVTPPAIKELPGADPGSPGDLPTNTPADLSMYLPTPTPLVLPDYPIPAPTLIPTMGPNGFPADSSAVTRLIIPRMNLDAVVKFVPYNGDTWLIGGLKQEIAWMGDTSWPGLGSNTGLAGHVDLSDGSEGPFWNLSNLAPGDTVKLYTERNLYSYTVRSQEIVDDHDLSVVDPTNEPQLTLITCTGWDPEFQTYLQRLIVYATLQGVQPLAQGNQ